MKKLTKNLRSLACLLAVALVSHLISPVYAQTIEATTFKTLLGSNNQIEKSKIIGDYQDRVFVYIQEKTQDYI